jgi:hypothetical protein
MPRNFVTREQANTWRGENGGRWIHRESSLRGAFSWLFTLFLCHSFLPQQFTLWVRTLRKTRTPTLTLTILRAFFFVTIQFSFFYHLDFCFKSSDTHTKSRPGRAERGRREERDIFFCVLFVYKKQNEKNIKDTEWLSTSIWICFRLL